MDANHIHCLYRQVTRSTAVAKLQTAAHELLGGALLFLVRHGDEVAEIHPPEGEVDLPEFCRLYRSSAEGLDCCMTCRSLMTFGACYRGSLEYSCHGGVRILATPALPQSGTDEQLVVASCAFSRTDREEGWLEFRDHARGLGIDLRSLRAAYGHVPVLTDDKRRIAFSLIEIGASLMNDLLGREDEKMPGPTPADDQPEPEDLEDLVSSALYLSQSQSARQRVPHGSLLVDRIKDMTSRNPSKPFTLKIVAQAARISPNHLSTIFRQFAGMTYTEFLLAQRIKLAKRLLRDLSLNIEEVAKATGFPTGSYFSRRFRLHTGMTPSEWRSVV